MRLSCFRNEGVLFETSIFIAVNVNTREKRERNCKSLRTPDKGGARGVMVIVVGNGRGDTSSNPGRD